MDMNASANLSNLPASLTFHICHDLFDGTAPDRDADFDLFSHQPILADLSVAGSVEPTFGVEPRLLETMPCPQCKLTEIFELGSTVSFSEGMHVIYIANDFGCLLGKPVTRQATQELRLCQSGVNVGHTVFNEAHRLELASTFGDLNRADLTSPVI